MLEKEFKYLLTAEQAEAARALFPWQARAQQVNFYYGADGRGDLPTVRIRSVGGRLLLQIKAPRESGAGEGSFHEEYEAAVCDVPAVLPGETLTALCPQFPFPALQLLGILVTDRAVYAPQEGVEVALDGSRYLGETDYELEVEYRGAPPLALLQKIEALGAAASAGGGKYGRFRARLRALGALPTQQPDGAG